MIAELFITEKKLNISLVLITQSYFTLSKTISLNSTIELFRDENSKQRRT